MKFKVGDKVKCMDTSNSYLEYGKVYDVSNAFSGPRDYYVNLVNEGDSGWSTSRFELANSIRNCVIIDTSTSRDHTL